MQCGADAGASNDADLAQDWAALVSAFLRHDRETPARLARVVDAHPACALGPLIKGYMLLMLARRELRPAAADALIEGRRRLAATPDARSALYAEGLESWLKGAPRGAVSAMERLIDEHPLDAMAIKISHAVRFMLGDADGMRRSLARVVSIYTDGTPHAGFIKGCYAFALEETGDYAQAEQVGRRAVELEPTDAWGRHAVAHVYEMTGRAQDGLRWLSDARAWSHCSNFSFHLQWHVALFQLELGRIGDALNLYDEAVRAERTDDYRDVANAASLLQRIEIAGGAVGDRWEELAAIAERRVHDRQLAFADLHYLLALLGAGRFSSAESLVAGMLDASVGEGGRNNRSASLAADVAAPLAAGILAFKSGRMRDAVDLLEPIRPRLQSLGGSHAQRDVFEQIYLEALVRSGGGRCVARLADRRADRGGRNHFAEQRLSAILAASGGGRTASDALTLTERLQAH